MILMRLLWKFLRRLALAVLLVAAVAAALLIQQGHQLYADALANQPLAERLAELRARPNYTAYDELPEFYFKAVVACEDRRFYTHHGVDPIAIGRALVNDIRAGALVEGGSTITQQLAKNLYFTQEKRFDRKIAEVFMARDIENMCSKQEILELYANSIYFGSGYYCIFDAAAGYYNKTPAELTLAECAMLAGLPNAPSAYSPTTNPQLAAERQQQVINKMQELDMLTAEEAAALK